MIAFAMFLFTFTTVMAYSVYLRGVYHYFFGGSTQGSLVKRVGLAVNIAIVILAFFGPLISSQTIWSLASALCGVIFLVNIVCLVFLYKPGVAVLRDYERQLKKPPPRRRRKRRRSWQSKLEWYPSDVQRTRWTRN